MTLCVISFLVYMYIYVYIFVLRLNVPVNIFSVMSAGANAFWELMCLAQGHNTVPLVGIEPRTSRFGVRRSTTTPPRSHMTYM